MTHSTREKHDPQIPELQEVVGVLSGDGECWTLEVTETEFRRVAGEEEYQQELSFRDDPTWKQRHPDEEQPWYLYPHHLFGRDHRPVRIRYQVEVLDDQPEPQPGSNLAAH